MMDDAPCVDYAGDPCENGQADVNPEVGSTTTFWMDNVSKFKY